MLHQDPNVITDFTMTGATGFLASNQGITFTFIKPPEERKPIAEVTAEMMGKLNTIPGVMTFLRPFPVLEISTGVTSQQQGQYAFTVSGANPSQVYDVGQKLMGKLMEYPGFLTVSSDFYNNTPNLNIDLRRDQAKTYGVSEARILTLLRNAYSQNYLYLIKKPEDQYQVILEMEDSAREKPEDLSSALYQIRRRSTSRAAQRTGHLEINAWSPGGESPEPVHQHDALFQSQAGRRSRRCDEFHQQGGGGDCAAYCARGTARRGADFQQHRHQLDDPDGAWPCL